MIIYIHGFGSSGNSLKTKELRKHFDNVVAPTLLFNPKENIKTLSTIIKNSTEPVTVIGTSLGGFYAYHLSRLFDVQAILINPAITPHITLQNFIGENTVFGTDTKFEVTKEHLEYLKNMYLEPRSELTKLLNVIVCKDDDVIPYTDVLKFHKYTNTTKVLETGGHRMDNFNEHIEYIKELIKEYYTFDFAKITETF